MNAFGNPTRDERLRHIAASLARIYASEPLKVPEPMKEKVRRLQDAPPKARPKVSPG